MLWMSCVTFLDNEVSTYDAMKFPKKSMEEVASVGQRYRAASRPQAEPINHHHPSGSLSQPGRLDRGRSLPV